MQKCKHIITEISAQSGLLLSGNLKMSYIDSGLILRCLIQLAHGLTIISRNDIVLFIPSRSFSLSVKSLTVEVSLRPLHLIISPHSTTPLLDQTSRHYFNQIPQKSPSISPKLHYYSLPVILLTERPQSTRYKCKKQCDNQ